MTAAGKTASKTTVKRSIDLDVPTEEAWRAITDEAALSEWLAPEVELDPQEGGEIACRFEDGEERRGTVELVEEAERLAFNWRREGGVPSRVEFVVDAVAGGSRLTVIETAYVATTPMLSVSWGPRLLSLRAALSLALA